MSLRAYLAAFAAAILFPVAVFAAIVGYFIVEQHRETIRRGAHDRVLAVSTAIDIELLGSIDALRALAAAPSLARGDVRYFRRVASVLLADHPDWININLALPDGQQLMNLSVPEGRPLPNIGELDGSFARLRETGQPGISDLAVGPVLKRWSLAVRVPVWERGTLKYVLSAGLNLDAIKRVIDAQQLPHGWVGVVIERQGRIVARSLRSEESVGKLASASLREGVARAPTGWFRGGTIEGTEVYTPYRRSEVTGWAFAMGIPVEVVDAAAWRVAALLALGLAAAVALALVLARKVGRSISGPIRALAGATEAIGRGERVTIPEAGRVAELRSLESALRGAVKAQDALTRAEEQTRAIVNHVLDGIITIDERGTVQSFNPGAEKLFGFQAAEVIAQNVKMLMPEPYRSGHDGYIGNYLHTGQAKIIGIGREVEGRRKDGSTFPMDLAVSEFRIGARRFFTGIVRDITERKRAEEELRASEERLRMALTAGRMGNWEWDVRTNAVSWSPDLEAIHGLAPGTFAGTFEAYKKDIHPEDWEHVQRAIAESLERGEHHMEYRIVLPDGEVRWVEGRGKVFLDASGAPMRVVGVCTDVTERKLAEEALRKSDRAKDEFLATLSHELRNPLAALTSAAHVLKVSDPSRPPAMEARMVVERQTKHMARLVGDLLDISRITFGKLALDREPLELGDAVARVVEMWRASGRFERHDVSLEVAPVWVDADPARVEQITANLLDNAVKFTPAGKAVRLSVARENSDAVLRVSDDGAGLTAEAAESVFDLFVSGDQSAGLGVGLALVKRLAELQGGSTSVASAGPGRGATFEVRLPAAQAPAPRERRERVGPAGTRSVLIVEDNEDARQMLEAVLALEGHEVRAASDGKTGLALAGSARPEVALIDIRLPDMDGYELARRLRAACDGARIGLVALTGFGGAQDEQRALDAGFDAHLVKPVSPERLKQVIATLA